MAWHGANSAVMARMALSSGRRNEIKRGIFGAVMWRRAMAIGGIKVYQKRSAATSDNEKRKRMTEPRMQ